MFWNKFFWPSMIVLSFVTALHWLASLNNYYSDVWWYDIAMHFLGGVWAALFLFWSISTQYGNKLKRYLCTRNILISVIVIGVLWEILELVMGFESFSNQNYFFDTLLDLVMDILGGAIVSIFYKK